MVIWKELEKNNSEDWSDPCVRKDFLRTKNKEEIFLKKDWNMFLYKFF